MANLDLLPVHAVNAYVWHELQEDGLLVPSDYPTSTPVPIIPNQQIPQFNDLPGGPPFIVYGWSEGASPVRWFEREVTIAYNFYSDNNSDHNRFFNVLDYLFREMDDSARRMNRWLRDNRPQFNEFNFHFTGLAQSASPDPRTTESGRMESVLAVSARYTRDL